MKEAVKTFFIMVLYFSASIFLHELSHHLFGVSSEMSLQRNYPLEAITWENRGIGIIGSLAGPVMNLTLAYIGYIVYRFGKNHLKRFGYYLGMANAFLVISGAIINLVVDLLSGSRGNDLEVVSRLLGWNILIIPLMITLLGLVPFWSFSKNNLLLFKKKYQLLLTLFLGWLSSGLLLMLLDSVLAIRFKIR